MKVTRYFQSCLLIEEGNARILIDPSVHENENINKLGKLAAVLYTHEHADHFDADMAKSFIEQAVAPVYANTSTIKRIKASAIEVKNGQELEINGFTVKVIELPHCLMWDGTAGPQNTGYLINGKLFHPGDGKELAGLTVESLALPINGPDVSILDAFNFAKQLSAKNLVPIHYDYLGGNPEAFANIGSGMGFKVHVLESGASADL